MRARWVAAAAAGAGAAYVAARATAVMRMATQTVAAESRPYGGARRASDGDGSGDGSGDGVGEAGSEPFGADEPEEPDYSDDPLGLGPLPVPGSEVSFGYDAERTPTVKRRVIDPADFPDDYPEFRPGASVDADDQTEAAAPEPSDDAEAVPPTMQRPRVAAEPEPEPEPESEPEPAVGAPAVPHAAGVLDLYGAPVPQSVVEAPETAADEDADGTGDVDVESDDGVEERSEEPSSPPIKPALMGFFFGVVCMLFAPVLYFTTTRFLFPSAETGDLAPFALLLLAVPAILVAIPRTRRFGLHMVLGLVVTGVVVSVTAVAVLYVLVKSGA